MATVFTQTRNSVQPHTMSWHHHTNSLPAPLSHGPLPSMSPASRGHRQQPSRKIRFAPLPDPRRAVLVTDDGEELPIPDGPAATQITAPPSPAAVSLEVQETSSLSSFASSSKRNSDFTEPSSASGSTTPASMTNTSNSDGSGSEPNSPGSNPVCLPPPTVPAHKSQPPPTPSSSGWPKSKGISFFRSFKRSSGTSSSASSSNSLTPTNSIDHGSSSRKGISTEEILTLGTINLFRASSRESGDGWNLTRWASAGPSSSTGPARNFGVPLTRTQSTQSTQSYKSKTPSLLSGLRPSSAPAPKSSKKPSAPVRKGTRMLNGRVYGAKRDPNANPFANARDDEPSFVEWGYGGMGSVKGAKSAGVAGGGWEKLGTGGDDDLEDATGTAWLKKRREAREAKAREEKEAKEKAERGELESTPSTDAAEKASNEANGDGDGFAKPDPISSTVSESSFPTPTASSADLTLTPSPTIHARSPSLSQITRADIPTAPSTPRIPVQSPSRELASFISQSEDDHVFKTMAIPPRPHHRTRSSSNATFTHGVLEVDRMPDLVKVDSESESESETESESDREEDDEDEEEEDGEEEEQRRKMVIGAGMEKVSWHRTEVEEHA